LEQVEQQVLQAVFNQEQVVAILFLQQSLLQAAAVVVVKPIMV
jgi:hypothetical protein